MYQAAARQAAVLRVPVAARQVAARRVQVAAAAQEFNAHMTDGHEGVYIEVHGSATTHEPMGYINYPNEFIVLASCECGDYSVENNGATRYTFAPDEDDIRFSFGMPYLESHLNTFLERFRNNPLIRTDSLCTTKQNRSVERLHFGCLDSEPRFKVVFTCRHHCCEMMANYELEGIIEEVLSKSEAGTWLAANVEFLAIPFMDKDGAEAGDQGKNRKPYDHATDYREAGIYNSVAALREFVPIWLAGKPAIGLDLHCPGPRGEFHEVILCPNRLRGEENWKEAKQFLDILETVQKGTLVFKTADSSRFTTWNGKPPGPPSPTFSHWIRSLPYVRFGAVIELPYANAGGAEVNQDTAREFGHDLARAFYKYFIKR